ncbi:hypothetical protein [Comamonas piscis]|nr:hypothetical protein [Comamonas piscis]WSO32515.1 hypothetical protein VUJ63_15265 [Comamonas piscis]
MLRVTLLLQWLNLSGLTVGKSLYDISVFAKLDPSISTMPDESTI